MLDYTYSKIYFIFYKFYHQNSRGCWKNGYSWMMWFLLFLCSFPGGLGLVHNRRVLQGAPWTGYDFHTYPHPAKKPIAARDVMVNVVNSLGLNLLAIHNENNEDNIAISPYGALSILVALGEGLQGEAVRELQKAAHIPNDISLIRVGLRDIHRHLQSYFIPPEGFLAGLTLNHDNVTLKPEYEDILRFYGFDIMSFNSALYPNPPTTKKPFVTTNEPTEEVTKTSIPLETTTLQQTTTSFENPTSTKKETTTVTSISSTTQTIPPTITTEFPMNDIAATTTSNIETTTIKDTTYTSENSILTTESKSTTESYLETTREEQSATTERSISTKVPTTTISTTTKSTDYTTLIADIDIVTTEKITTEEITTNQPTTAAGKTTTTEMATEIIITKNPPDLSTENIPEIDTVEVAMVDSTTTKAVDLSEILTTEMIPTESDGNGILTTEMIPTESSGDEILTTEMSPTESSGDDILTTEMRPTESGGDQILTTEIRPTGSDGDEILTTEFGENEISTMEPSVNEISTTETRLTESALGEILTTEVQSVETFVPQTSIFQDQFSEITTVEVVATEATTIEPVASAEITTEETLLESTSSESEIETTSLLSFPYPDASTPEPEVVTENQVETNETENMVVKRKARSKPNNPNKENNIKKPLSLAGNRIRQRRSKRAYEESNKKSISRKARSVIDYMLARYYDSYHPLQSKHGVLYVPPPKPSFLVQGKYREYQVEFMKYDTVLPFFYVSHLKALALSFPLDSPRYYLLILLPVDENGVDQLICDLRLNGSFKYIIENLRYRHVAAVIPSFLLKGYVNLTPTFQKLGIRRVFEPRQADFSPMTNLEEIYITNIEQAITVNIKHYVDPAAFATNRQFHHEAPIEFRADHPFVYFVVDAELHVVLMTGKVVNPLNTRIT